MNIGIIVAMDSEYKQFISLQKENKLKDKNITVHQCGIGKVNAAMNTFALFKDKKPDIVLSTGVAGGCSDDIEIMDIVCAEKVSYHDVWCGKPNKLGQVQGMPTDFLAPKETLNKIKSLYLDKIKFGKTVSGDWFVDTADKMQEIKTNFPDATAVDMESAAIAQVCYQLNIPFISLRTISDIPLKGNNHTQYKDFWENVADNSFNTTKQIILSL